MININRDTIATYARADIYSIPRDDFISTLDAHDDAAHFAELDLIELRDDLDRAIMIFAFDAPSDDAIDDIADAYLDAFRDDDTYDFIYRATLDAINDRINNRI